VLLLTVITQIERETSEKQKSILTIECPAKHEHEPVLHYFYSTSMNLQLATVFHPDFQCSFYVVAGWIHHQITKNRIIAITCSHAHFASGAQSFCPCTTSRHHFSFPPEWQAWPSLRPATVI